MFRATLLICLALWAAPNVVAQLTVRGTVTDAETGEPMQAVTIVMKGLRSERPLHRKALLSLISVRLKTSWCFHFSDM